MLDRALGPVGLLLCVLWFGCDSSTTEPVSGATDEGAGAPAESSSGDLPGAEDRCPALPGACSGEAVCENYACGGRAAVYNHFGCPRLQCGADTDCPPGEACFVAVYETSCAPSNVQCGDVDGTCACASADDCDGVSRAHCLPTEFYPPAEYCDPSSRSCAELTPWIAALDLTAAALRADGRDALAPDVEACSALASVAAQACP